VFDHLVDVPVSPEATKEMHYHQGADVEEGSFLGQAALRKGSPTLIDPMRRLQNEGWKVIILPP
jgi:hypothetical protein